MVVIRSLVTPRDEARFRPRLRGPRRQCLGARSKPLRLLYHVSATRPERRFVTHLIAVFPSSLGCLVAGAGHLRALARRLVGRLKAALEPAGSPPTVADHQSPGKLPQAKA